MPIELAIWRLGNQMERVKFQSIKSEAKLEEALAKDLSILTPDLMLIGRQIVTAFGKFTDLLAMDRDGELVIIELKRDKTPREVVAQAIDYASWVDGLSYDEIVEIFAEHNGGKKFEEGYGEVFDASPPADLNQSHRMVIVASELDASTERIINYLGNKYGVPINAVFFRCFQDGGNEYLTRTWLIDPQEAEVKASKSVAQKRSEPWNGRDFYVSQGEFADMNWDDCCKYGFVCGSGGRWYTQTLNHLFVGARVFVNIPGTGYVGIGTVKETSRPVPEFTVELNGQTVPILKAPLVATDMGKNANDLDLCPYLVRVEWLKTVSREDAYWEKGLFAIQHTACKLRSRFTIEKVTQHFGLDE